jgi:hypothetical protein
MKTDPYADQLYLDDDDGEEPEEWPVRAAETFPWWGQLLAWMTWRCPMWVYLLVFASGVALPFFGYTALGVAAGLLGLASSGFCLYARTQQLDPFRYSMIVTRRPIPPEDVAAAASGAPVPPGTLERTKETQT